MSALRVKLQRLAKEDLRDAHVWYETRTPGLGADFVREVVAALRRAAERPSIYPIVDREFKVRRALVKRFRYKAFYTVEPDRVVVHAIIDARRSDENWEKRIG